MTMPTLALEAVAGANVTDSTERAPVSPVASGRGITVPASRQPVPANWVARVVRPDVPAWLV
ncbi:MAG: hypothetical protein ACK5QX_10755 [bacterium]